MSNQVSLPQAKRLLALGIAASSVGVALLITYLSMAPPAGELLELAAALGIGAVVSLVLIELASRDRGPVARMRLRPRLAIAAVTGLAIALINVLALALFMFVSADHDLPLLVAALAFSGMLGAFAGWRVAGVVSSSLVAMSSMAGLVAAGEFGARVDTGGGGEVEALAKSLNEMASSLEEASRRQVQLEEGRKQMTAAVSHDLRTPLASARVMLEALSDGVVTDEAERSEYVRRSLVEIKNLSGLVDDLFQLSLLDIGAMRLDVKPTPLQQLVLDTVHAFEPSAGRKGLKLNARLSEALGEVMVDEARIRRVLMNLLQNAIRHTPPDGTVTVEAVDQGDSVRVEVRDTGEGIAPEDLPRIWNRFFRADTSRTKDAEGMSRSGLGLAIARAIVETHGGRIWATSEPGRGASFRFTLPKHRPAAA